VRINSDATTSAPVATVAVFVGTKEANIPARDAKDQVNIPRTPSTSTPSQTQKMTPANNTPPTKTDSQQPADEGLDDATCSAFDLWWQANGVKIEPPIMQEAMKEVAAKGWNAAINATLLSLPGGSTCDPQCVADSIRELIEPNA
jgi:hypothetical protein